MKTPGQIAYEVANSPEWGYASWEKQSEGCRRDYEIIGQAVRQATIDECAQFVEDEYAKHLADQVRALKDKK